MDDPNGGRFAKYPSPRQQVDGVHNRLQAAHGSAKHIGGPRNAFPSLSYAADNDGLPAPPVRDKVDEGADCKGTKRLP